MHNQENIIIENLVSILNNTTEKYYEIIIIIDSCSDNSELKVNNWIETFNFINYNLITNILLLKSDIPLFETVCDNIGLICSNGIYFLEIQADMKMTDYGYNMKLLKPFLLDNNIIGISGRCCHDFDCKNGVGKLGINILKTIEELNIETNVYYIADTCNRGPLLLSVEKVKKLGYFDEVNYYLDNSDHDLFARANYYKNWLCGYVPINFVALLENGSTRKTRNEINQYYYELKQKETQNGINGFLIKNLMIKKTIEKKYLNKL